MKAQDRRPLTSRELEVYELLRRGLSNAQIGEVLGISPSTAKNHVSALLLKLDVCTRTEAVGLVAPSSDPSLPVERQVLPASALQSGPSGIAVLQFDCFGADPHMRQLADGIADDLITRLSRRWYPVIARCSTFNVDAGARADARALGELLGARYLVEGGLTHAGVRVRLNVRLVDVHLGHVIWSERYDGECTQLFDMLDELSHAVMEGVFEAAVRHSTREFDHVPAASLASWQLGLRGMWHLWRCTKEHNAQARDLFLQALAIDADQALSLYGSALTYQREISEQWSVEPSASLAQLERIAQHFVGRWPNDPWALLLMAYVSLYQGDRLGAMECVARSLAREPSSLGGHSLHGQLLAMDGQSALAVVELEKALRLCPRSPERWIHECVMALAYFAAGAYEQAIAWGHRSVQSNRGGAMAHGVLASSYFHLGERVQAKSAAESFNAVATSFSDERFKPMIASTRPEIAARFLEGLQGASTC